MIGSSRSTSPPPPPLLEWNLRCWAKYQKVAPSVGRVYCGVGGDIEEVAIRERNGRTYTALWVS